MFQSTGRCIEEGRLWLWASEPKQDTFTKNLAFKHSLSLSLSVSRLFPFRSFPTQMLPLFRPSSTYISLSFFYMFLYEPYISALYYPFFNLKVAISVCFTSTQLLLRLYFSLIYLPLLIAFFYLCPFRSNLKFYFFNLYVVASWQDVAYLIFDFNDLEPICRKQILAQCSYNTQQ